MTDITFRAALSDAIRYWEWRRVIYNLALSAVVGAVFIAYLPSSRSGLNLVSIQWLFVLAVLANVAYCAAYVVDLVAQLSAARSTWLRFRWMLLAVGIAFAGVLANYFSQGIFPHAIYHR
jgi:hypothetical protein